jgi:hypothetical protein
VFVATFAAAVAANAEGRRFGRIDAVSEESSLERHAGRVCEQGPASVVLQPQALDENLNTAHGSLLSEQVVDRSIALAPGSVFTPVRRPGGLHRSCPIAASVDGKTAIGKAAQADLLRLGRPRSQPQRVGFG